MVAVAPSVTYNSFQRWKLGHRHPFVPLFKSEESFSNRPLPPHPPAQEPFPHVSLARLYHISMPKPIPGKGSGITLIGLA